MLVFKIVYFVGMVLQVVIRAPYARMAKTGEKIEKRESRTENVLLGIMTVVAGVIPLIYAVTPWLGFADYHLPGWMGWAGVLLLGCSLAVFYFGHRDLKANWSPTLEIRKDHSLVTDGIYQYIRHPMYASQLLWVVAQILLMQNWLAGPLDLVFFIPFYTLRVGAEEKMMLDTFGSQYGEYMKKVGGLLPKI